MSKYILSIDSGGIRAIIPSIILAEIEKRVKKPSAEIFDLMAGTSTGGIVVAALSKQSKPHYSPNDLVDFFREYGPHIFKSTFFRQWFSWFNTSRYSHKGIESVLDKYFSDEILKNTRTNLLIPSYDIYNDRPYFFKSWKAERNFIKLKDVLRATTATPTYFTPKWLKFHDIDRVLVDGGLFAYNPAACAYASGKMLFPHDEIVLLSIGTGRIQKRIQFHKSSKFGRIGWVKPISRLLRISSIDVVNYQLYRMIGKNYIRIQQINLEGKSQRLDNIAPKNIEYLKQEAEAIIEENKETMDELCDVLNKKFQKV